MDNKKEETAKIISWRIAGVVIPWLTIFAIVMVVIEKSVRIKDIVEKFPAIVEVQTRQNLKITKLEDAVIVLKENSDKADKRFSDMQQELRSINNNLVRILSKR